MAILTKERLHFLFTNPETQMRAVGRALVALNERQTFDEQVSQNTKHHNGMGFKPSDAYMGTSMANFYTMYNRLSPKQVKYWINPNKKGVMRIEAYHRQLIEVATAKAETITAI